MSDYYTIHENFYLQVKNKKYPPSTRKLIAEALIALKIFYVDMISHNLSPKYTRDQLDEKLSKAFQALDNHYAFD